MKIDISRVPVCACRDDVVVAIDDLEEQLATMLIALVQSEVRRTIFSTGTQILL